MTFQNMWYIKSAKKISYCKDKHMM